MSIKITENLFAHIFNDPFLTGSYQLTGQNFSNTIGLLKEFMDEWACSKKVPKDVNALFNACDTLLKQEQKLSEIELNPADEVAIYNLAKDWFNLIKSTKADKDDYLLLPGGWGHQSGGHAMIYQFQRAENGDLIFTINNSGAGICYHAKRSEADKELYCPTLKYCIPHKHASDAKNFIPVLAELIKAQIHNLHTEDSIDETHLYERVFEKLHFLKATIIEPAKEEYQYFTGGQLSGTCAQRSVHQMLKARFRSVDNYRQFIFLFKQYALDRYMKQLEENGLLGLRKHHPQIRKAINHLLRLFNSQKKDKDEPLFPYEGREAYTALFNKYLTKLRTVPVVSEPAPTPKPSTTLRDFELSFSTKNIHDHSNTDIAPSPVLNEPKAKQLVATKLLETMRQVNETCSRLRREGNYDAVFEQLENFFLALPIPYNRTDPLLDFYKEAGVHKHPQTFFSLMTDLQKNYFHSADRVFGSSVVLPRMMTVKASNYAVCAHVARHADYLLSSDFASIIDTLPISLNQLNGRAVQLSHQNPRLDRRLQSIRKLYNWGSTFPSGFHDNMLQHYKNLIAQYPDLHAALKEKFNEKFSDNTSAKINKIRAMGCEALYYFTKLNISDPVVSDQSGQFKPIHDALQKQEELEYAFTCGLPRLWNHMDFPDPVSLEYKTYSGKLKLTSTIQRDENHFCISPSLEQSVYSGVKGSVQDCFSYYVNQGTNLNDADYGVPKSTDVQLRKLPKQTSSHRFVRPEDIEERELYHLRHQSDSQIKLTLEYFLKHPEKLLRREMQIYCEANIFEGSLLFDILASFHNKSFWNLLERFTEQGIEQSKKQGSFSRQSLFYVHLYQAIHTYAYQQDPGEYADRIINLINKLNLWIHQPQHLQQLAELHYSRFLCMNALYQNNESFSEDQMVDLFESYFMLKTHPLPESCNEPDAAYRLKRDIRAFMFRMRNEPSELAIQKILDTLRDHHLIPPSSKLIDANYPTIHLADNSGNRYKINLQQGFISRNNLSLTHTPQDILQHPIMIQLNMGDVRQCYQTANQKQFILEKKPIKLRFTRQNDQYLIEQLFQSKEEKPVWHELLAVNVEQHNYLKLANGRCLTSTIPSVLQQRETFVWKNGDNPSELIMTDDNNQVQYVLARKRSKWEIRRLRDNAVLYNKLHQTEKSFAAIESPGFMLIHVDDKGNIDCELPRYNLHFRKEASSSHYKWHWDGKDRSLDIEQDLQKQGLPAITFSDQKLCVIPVGRFLSTGTREADSEYYRFELDKNNQIAKDVVKRKRKDESAKYTLPLIWQHKGSGQVMVMKMKAGEPYPETPAQALYLCYLYLGNHQEEKALAILDKCDKWLGGLEGSFEELQYLQWICDALPYQPENDKAAKKATISTPPVVACQLKALSLWSRLNDRNRKVTFPDTEAAPANPNAYYQKATVVSIKSFQDNGLNSHIYEFYQRYQLMRRDMPVDFLLSESESRSLLNFYHDQIPSQPDKGPKVIGAIGYDWLRLNIVNLKRELDRIEQKAKENELTPYEKSRQHDIQTWINNHEGVYRKQSKLVKANINLDINSHRGLVQCPRAKSSFLRIFPENIYDRMLHSLSSELINALTILNPCINATDFEDNFGYYLAIALKNDEQTDALESFCKSYLRASRHATIDKQPTNIPYLCNVLYRVICKTKSQGFTHHQFNSLIEFKEIVDRIIPEPIHVYQLEDSTQSLLISAEHINDSIPETQPALPPKVSHEQQEKVEQLSLFPADICSELMKLAPTWQELESKFYHIEEKDYDSDSEDELEKESKAGEHKYKLLMDMQRLARSVIDNKATIIELNKQASFRLEHLQQQQSKFEAPLLALANSGPNDKGLKVAWDIDISANKRKPLDINQLLGLYFQADINQYRQTTGLPDDKIDRLHGQIAEYLKRGLFIQQLERICQQADKLEKQSTPPTNTQLYQLAQALFATNKSDVVLNPAISVFQYHENILLRPHQSIGIETLLEKDPSGRFKEIVAKVVMGGGKSKVFSPILAYQKANGENLVLLEVPKSLLRTNFTDLKAMSNQLFGQTAVLFDFSRDSDCSPKALEARFRLFSDAMVNKKYLVTTGESLQSLELKYLELLEGKPQKADKKAFAEWEQQVYWAEKLVLFLRNRGDCIIDEVHQGLLLKNRLNYTIGVSKSIPKFVSNEIVSLYQFFQHVPLDGVEGLEDTDLTMDSLLLPYKPFKKKEQFDQVSRLLVDQLLSHQQSPLLAALKRSNVTLSKDETLQLKNYFFDQCDDIPAFIFTLPEDLQDIIALYKEEANHLLPFSLKRNANEHYGPSKNSYKSIAQRAIAIPYRANNAPNELSNFGNEIESINYTIQSMLINGVSEELLEHYLQFLLKQAQADAEENKKASINDTPAGHLFKSMTKGLSLAALDLDDAVQMSQLYATMAKNQTLIFEVLKTQVLPNIRMNTNVLSSNALNHVDMLRSVQGYSGTPWNASTYHQRLKYHRELAAGTDGYIIESLQKKHTPVKAVNFAEPDKLVNTLLNRYGADDKLRSIIDISAAFKGISNEAVARQISGYIAQHKDKFNQPKKVKYVLFFNEKDELCAITVGQKSGKVITLGTSNEEVIAEKLGCSPDSRFTYYDQAHTLGTDIRQSEEARAVALCDQDTGISAFTQGALRLRQLLEGQQSIDVFVPEEMKSMEDHLDRLCKNMQLQEQIQLRQDNYIAAHYKMANFIRNDLFKRILNYPGAAIEKAELLKQFRNQFIDQQSDRLFHRFGGIAKMEDTDKLLKKHQKALLDSWEKMLEEAKINVVPNEKASLTQQMDEVIEGACKPGVCDEKQLSPSQVEAMEVELFTEVEKLEERLTEQYDPSHQSQYFQSWYQGPYGYNLTNKTLSEIVNSAAPTYIPDFSDNITATKNFYKIYKGQKNYLTQTMMPVHGVYFKIESGKLQCILLSPEELEQAKNYISLNPSKKHWVSTTNHTVLYGSMPEDIKKDPQYQSAVEQIRFFAGDLDALVKRDAPLSWLNEDTSQKLDFYESYLASARESDPTHLQQLRMGVMTLGKMMNFMAQQPDRDLTDFDWESRFPSAEESEINEMKQVALAFKTLTGSWWNDDITADKLVLKHNLSPLALGQLALYQTELKNSVYINKLKRLILTLSNHGFKKVAKDITPLMTAIFSGSVTEAKKLVEKLDENDLLPLKYWDKGRFLDCVNLDASADGPHDIGSDPVKLLPTILAKCPFLTKGQFFDLINQIEHHPGMWYNLLTNELHESTLKDDPTAFKSILTAISKLSVKQRQLFLSSEPSLSSTLYDVINRQSTELINTIIQTICDVFDPEAQSAVFDRLTDSQDCQKSILEAIFKYSTDTEVLLSVAYHTHFTEFNYGVIKEKIRDYETPIALLEKIAQYNWDSHDKTYIPDFLLNPNLNEAIYTQLLIRCINEDSCLSILDQQFIPLMNTDNLTQMILNPVTKAVAVQNRLITIVKENFEFRPVISELLSEHKPVSAKVLISLYKDEDIIPDEEARVLKDYNFKNAEPGLMSLLMEKARNPDLLSKLIINSQFEQINKKALINICQNTELDDSLITRLLGHPLLDTDVVLALSQHQLLSVDHIRILLLKEQDKPILNQDCYIAVVRQQHCSQEQIHHILTQTYLKYDKVTLALIERFVDNKTFLTSLFALKDIDGVLNDLLGNKKNRHIIFQAIHTMLSAKSVDPALIHRFVQYPHLTPEIRNFILHHPDVQQKTIDYLVKDNSKYEDINFLISNMDIAPNYILITNALLGNPNLTEALLVKLLEKMELNPSQIKTALSLPICSNVVLARVIDTVETTDVINRICHHENFDSDLLHHIIDNYAHDHDRLHSIFTNERIDKYVLELIDQPFVRATIMKAVDTLLSNTDIEPELIHRIANYPKLDLECIKKILMNPQSQEATLQLVVRQEPDEFRLSKIIGFLQDAYHSELCISLLLENPNLTTKHVLQLITQVPLSESQKDDIRKLSVCNSDILRALVKKAVSIHELTNNYYHRAFENSVSMAVIRRADTIGQGKSLIEALEKSQRPITAPLYIDAFLKADRVVNLSNEQMATLMNLPGLETINDKQYQYILGHAYGEYYLQWIRMPHFANYYESKTQAANAIILTLLADKPSEYIIQQILDATAKIDLSSNVYEHILLLDNTTDVMINEIEKRKPKDAKTVINHIACYRKYQQLMLELDKLEQLNAETSENEDLTDNAKKAAKSLHNELLKAAKELVNKSTGLINKEKIQLFQKQCHEVFQDKKRIAHLKEHPQFWYRISPIVRAIVGIIAAMLVIPGLAVHLASEKGYKHVFFTNPKTIGEERYDEVTENIENLLPEEPDNTDRP